MFKQKETVSSEGVDSLIGANTIFEGNITSQGTVRVEGKVKGDIKVSGDIFIGLNAVVTGNITANNFHLAGTVEGNIQTTGVFRMLSSAKLYGDIRVHSFVADEGGLFQGKCTMEEAIMEDLPKSSSSKHNSSKDYKKSSVLDQVYEEKEKNNQIPE